MQQLESNKWLIEYEVDGGIGSVRAESNTWKTRDEMKNEFKEHMGYYPQTVLCIGDSRIRK